MIRMGREFEIKLETTTLAECAVEFGSRRLDSGDMHDWRASVCCVGNLRGVEFIGDDLGSKS